MPKTSAIVVMLATLAAWGCSPYQLVGVVQDSSISAVETLSGSDTRLKNAGIEGATVEFTLDPSSLSPKVLGTATTDSEGRFVIDIDEMGAGFLEYQVGVLAQATGYKTVYQEIRLPGKGRQIRITLEAGKDQYQRDPDLLKDTLKMGNDLLKKAN